MRKQTIRDENHMVEAWRMYCIKLYNAEDNEIVNTALNNPTRNVAEPESESLLEEVANSITYLKINKAPGPDSTSTEIFKFADEEITKIIYHICNESGFSEE